MNNVGRAKEGHPTSKPVLVIGLSLVLAAGAAAGLQIRGGTEPGLVQSERQPRLTDDETQVSRVAGVNEDSHRRVLAIKERVLGPGHPSVATSVNALADLYEFQGRSPEAEQLYRRVLTINGQARGPAQPHISGSLAGSAALFRSRNQEAAAAKLEAVSAVIRARQVRETTTDLPL